MDIFLVESEDDLREGIYPVGSDVRYFSLKVKGDAPGGQKQERGKQ